MNRSNRPARRNALPALLFAALLGAAAAVGSPPQAAHAAFARAASPSPRTAGETLIRFLDTNVGRRLTRFDPFWGHVKRLSVADRRTGLAAVEPLIDGLPRDVRAALPALLADADDRPEDEQAKLIEKLVAAHVDAADSVDRKVRRLLWFSRRNSEKDWLALKSQLEALAPYSPKAQKAYDQTREMTAGIKSFKIGSAMDAYSDALAGKAAPDSKTAVRAAAFLKKKAMPALHAAIFRDDAEAQHALGMMHETGAAGQTLVNDAEAANWYRKAAVRPWGLGVVGAQLRLADMYEEGRGVERSDSRAHLLFTLAARQNSQLAGVKMFASSRRMKPDEFSRAQTLAGKVMSENRPYLREREPQAVAPEGDYLKLTARLSRRDFAGQYGRGFSSASWKLAAALALALAAGHHVYGRAFDVGAFLAGFALGLASLLDAYRRYVLNQKAIGQIVRQVLRRPVSGD